MDLYETVMINLRTATWTLGGTDGQTLGSGEALDATQIYKLSFPIADGNDLDLAQQDDQRTFGSCGPKSRPEVKTRRNER